MHTTLSLSDARRLFLYSQGLLGHEFGRSKAGLQRMIEHMGYVQIDTIAVVERAHHHTIFTRLSDYSKKHLDTLLEKDKQIFEYWSHAAAYLPMRDYRFSLPRKKLFADGKQHWFKDQKPTKYVYDRIRAEGPLQSKDFEEKKAQTGWYEWKTTKQALEQLFMEGKLMVAARRNFQKVYDLTERVLPAGIDTRMPTEREMAEHLIEAAIRTNGMATVEEIAYLRRGVKEQVSKAIKHMLKEGTLLELKMEGVAKCTVYTTPSQLELLDAIKLRKKVQILSPFDNAVIQRKRLQNLFNYDYVIECYVPEPKRVHGYFCLPILYGDVFAGRMDCKADSKTGIFSVRKLWIEDGFKVTDPFVSAFARATSAFAAFNGSESIQLDHTNLPKKTMQAIKSSLT
jgi:uncharacterized protein YcaQ